LKFSGVTLPGPISGFLLVNLRQFAHTTIHAMGYEIRAFRPGISAGAQLIKMLGAHSIDVVLDVGANVGQFGTELRNSGYQGVIVSFEPQAAARIKLCAAIGRDSLWKIADQVALGATDGDVDLNLAANSASSSVLPMLKRHSDAAPESVYIGSERVPLRRLDDLVQAYITDRSKVFLKIDTQGYEDRVLEGGRQTLGRAVGLCVELSFVPLYAGQLLYKEMVPRLEALGFELWNLTPALIDKNDGRLLQADGTFFRAR
jgi:FkbM family methyltransferase